MCRSRGGLDGCGIESLASLGSIDMPRLLILRATTNPMSSLEGIGALLALRSLNISLTPVADLSPVADLVALQSILLRGTEVTSLSPLAEHPTLQSITAEGSKLTDIAALSTLPSFQRAGLENNEITDLSALEHTVWDQSTCPHLDVRGNPLDAYAVEVVIPALCERHVRVWHDGGFCGDLLSCPAARP